MPDDLKDFTVTALPAELMNKIVMASGFGICRIDGTEHGTAGAISFTFEDPKITNDLSQYSPFQDFHDKTIGARKRVRVRKADGPKAPGAWQSFQLTK